MNRRRQAQQGNRSLAGAIALIGAISVLTILLATVAATAADNNGNHMDPRKQAIMAQALTPAPGPFRPKPLHPEVMPCPTVTRPVDAGQIVDPNLHGYPVALASLYQVTTLWRDARNNRHLIIYAGFMRDDPTQGFIDVLDFNECTGEYGAPGDFDTPTKVGALTLTEVQGDIVSFSYPGGHGTFNLGSHRFTMSAD